MNNHDCVLSCTRVNYPSDYIYLIERTKSRPPVNVYLSDSYDFGLAEYLGRPPLLGRGDFILIARPEACWDFSLVERAWLDGIGIGGIAKLMGALNRERIWEYVPPEKSKQSVT